MTVPPVDPLGFETIHLCHALGCRTQVPRRMLMCRAHWRMVPGEIQEMVCEAFTPGQEEGSVRPSREWVEAARAAVGAVARMEERARDET